MHYPYLCKEGATDINGIFPFSQALMDRGDMVPITAAQFEAIKKGGAAPAAAAVPVVDSIEGEIATAKARAERLMNTPDAESMPKAALSDDEWLSVNGLPPKTGSIPIPTVRKAVRDFGLQHGASIPSNWSLNKTIAAARTHIEGSSE